MDLPPPSSIVVVVDFAGLVEVCWHPARVRGLEVGPERAFTANLKRRVENLSLALGRPLATFWMVQESWPAAKYKACPTYKANRPRRAGCDRFDPFQRAEEWLRRRHVRFLRARGHEADDAIAALVHHLTALPGRRNERQVLVVTADRDLWALLSYPRTRVYDLLRKRMVAQADLDRAYGVEPHLLTLYKAIWGDATDGVPNAAPHQQSRLLPLLRSSGGDLERFLGLAYYEGVDVAQVRLNWLLVRLATDAPVAWVRDEYEME